MKNDKKRQFNCPVTYKENNKNRKGKTLKKKQSTSEGCVRGVRIPQNRTELRINTAQQNKVRKLLTALELPENFLIPQSACFFKTAIPQLKIKISEKPHQKSSKPASPQTLPPPSIPAMSCALTLSERFNDKCIELISTNFKTPFHLSDSP